MSMLKKLEIPEDWYSELVSHAKKHKDFGFSKKDSKPMVMVEYSSPNTNKPLHLGHL